MEDGGKHTASRRARSLCTKTLSSIDHGFVGSSWCIVFLYCVLSSCHFLRQKKRNDRRLPNQYDEQTGRACFHVGKDFQSPFTNGTQPPSLRPPFTSVSICLRKGVAQLLQQTAGGTQRSPHVSDKWVQRKAVYLFFYYPCLHCIHLLCVLFVILHQIFSVQPKSFSTFSFE